MQQERPASFSDSGPNGAVAGIVIAVCATATIFAIAHHPVSTTRDPARLLGQIVQLTAVGQAVHGIVIVLAAGLLFAFTVYALRRGLHRQTVTAALVAYALGIGALIGAALIDGFLIGALAKRYAGASAETITVAVQLLGLCAMGIQVLSKFGELAVACAMVLWSADLVRTPGALRATAIVGFVAGAATAGMALFTGYLNPHSLGAIVVLQAIWYVAIAALLIRGRL